MRIIAGTARRVRLEVAEESTARPFLETARGALFNSLAERVAGAAVLDLYAGSGALGLEALSRGAASCVFVERDAAAVAVLKKNAAKCGFPDSADLKNGASPGVRRIVRADVRIGLEREAAAGALFDLIFVDPPFPELAAWTAEGVAGGVMRLAAEVLAPEGVLVFRLEEGKIPPPEWPGLAPAKEQRHGRSRICRYVKKDGL